MWHSTPHCHTVQDAVVLVLRKPVENPLPIGADRHIRHRKGGELGFLCTGCRNAGETSFFASWIVDDAPAIFSEASGHTASGRNGCQQKRFAACHRNTVERYAPRGWIPVCIEQIASVRT